MLKKGLLVLLIACVLWIGPASAFADIACWDVSDAGLQFWMSDQDTYFHADSACSADSGGSRNPLSLAQAVSAGAAPCPVCAGLSVSAKTAQAALTDLLRMRLAFDETTVETFGEIQVFSDDGAQVFNRRFIEPDVWVFAFPENAPDTSRYTLKVGEITKSAALCRFSQGETRMFLFYDVGDAAQISTVENTAQPAHKVLSASFMIGPYEVYTLFDGYFCKTILQTEEEPFTAQIAYGEITVSAEEYHEKQMANEKGYERYHGEYSEEKKAYIREMSEETEVIAYRYFLDVQGIKTDTGVALGWFLTEDEYETVWNKNVLNISITDGMDFAMALLD